MHRIVRRIPRRISRSVNYCGEFNVFSKERGCDERSLILNEDGAARSARSIIGWNARKNLALSRTFARDFATSARRKPPEPRGIPFFGTMLFLAMAGGPKRLHEYVDRRHRELGPVFRERIGPLWAVFVNSPDEFRRIFLKLEGPTPQHFLPEAWRLYNEIREQRRGLLFMDGDEWLRFRRILNKTMLMPDPTELMCAPCQKVAENLTRKLKTYSLTGSTIPNLEHQLYLWSIEVMLATLIGSRWQDWEPQIGSEMDYLALMLHQIFVYSVTLSMMPAKLAMRLRLPAWTKFVRTADTIMAKVHSLIPKMISLSSDGLLRMMMNEGIGNDDVVRIVADFIVAAGDTTAVTMQWVLLLLSSRPELQDQLFYDIKDLSPKEILRHPLLKGVWREALRLHPIAPFLSRYLLEDATIGGYFVSKEDLILLSFYSSGRNGEDFPEPNEFRPERWVRTKEHNLYQGVRNSHATLPFAMGVRSCVGRKLAETQLSLTLAQLIKTFKIKCENRDSVKMILHLISVPSRPIQLKLTKRDV